MSCLSLQPAVNRNINQFQRLMRGHGARHTYTPVWRSTATFICGGYVTPDYLHKYNIYTSTVHSFRTPVLRARIERVLADQRQDEAQL